MTTSVSTSERKPNEFTVWIKTNLPLLVVVLVLIALPFVIGLANGDSIGDVLRNESGNSKFIQGLLIEVFVLAIYAISYDLVLGITGLLSFGHAMFFAVGAYLTGILLKSFGWTLLPTIGAVILAGIVQAILFAIVLPRVHGLTFALVTLGMASVFAIMIGTRELAEYTGADVGLQGIPRPELLDPVSRLRFYLIALAFTVLIYLLYRRFVDSPTGRVCVAIRENEGRARMLGFNTFYFKLAALTVASITAALAGLLSALYRPIVSPEVAHMGYTVDALLIILIGGMGTLSGAMIGAALYRLLQFYLHKWFGESAAFLLGALYVAFVLFVPYGIVGTWRLRRFDRKQGWQRLIRTLTGGGDETAGQGPGVDGT
jgi:branched-chain amino acid transport system permease protein